MLTYSFTIAETGCWYLFPSFRVSITGLLRGWWHQAFRMAYIPTKDEQGVRLWTATTSQLYMITSYSDPHKASRMLASWRHDVNAPEKSSGGIKLGKNYQHSVSGTVKLYAELNRLHTCFWIFTTFAYVNESTGSVSRKKKWINRHPSPLVGEGNDKAIKASRRTF